MNGAATWLFGPLVAPECKRALARGRVVWMRGVAAALLAGIAVCILWWWWTAQQLEPNFRPYSTLRAGLIAWLATEITLALTLGPALMAGSLAGEKERGSLGLLMTTRVSPREIVMGRAAAMFSQIAMALLTGLPALVLLAELAGIRPPSLAAMAAQPLAVAFGVGGLSLATSAMSRRGRDALLVVYLLVTLALIVPPLLALLPAPWSFDALKWISPYHGISETTWEEEPAGSLGVIVLWTGIGVAGLVVASQRLRPSWLRLIGGDERGRGGKRNIWVPPVGDRPILWKELHIERAGSLGRVGKWLGVIVVAYLVLPSTILAGNVLWYSVFEVHPKAVDQYRVLLGEWITDRAWIVSALVQLAVALRAAVAVSSERERGTWDGLLTSPLEGKEIVRGKLWGSLYALRWLLAGAFWAWTLALVCGAMSPREYGVSLATTVLISACAAAFGIRVSLTAGTATKAMTMTVIFWLAAIVGFLIVASVVAGVSGMVAMFVWDQAYLYGLTATPIGPRILLGTFNLVWWPGFLVPFLVTTLLVLSDSHLRFDRLSGRMTGGDLTVRLDGMLHGSPLPPVLVGTPHKAEETKQRDSVRR